MTGPEEMDPAEPRLPWSEDLLRYTWQPRVETGEGWWPIIAELDKQLKEVAPDYRVVQVKEKFGGLRYYYTGAVDYELVQPLIRAAEEKCAVTCEVCGRGGKLRSPRGWYVTLCDEDFAAREARIAEDKRFLNGE